MRHPKVVWLGVKDPESLIGLAEKVDSAVKGMKLKSDDKRFSPHITIGRVNGRADLGDFFSRYKRAEICSFRCDHVDVMKSVLTPKGAIHSVVERIEL
jgi:2'-5' RNA ligase